MPYETKNIWAVLIRCLFVACIARVGVWVWVFSLFLFKHAGIEHPPTTPCWGVFQAGRASRETQKRPLVKACVAPNDGQKNQRCTRQRTHHLRHTNSWFFQGFLWFLSIANLVCRPPPPHPPCFEDTYLGRSHCTVGALQSKTAASAWQYRPSDASCWCKTDDNQMTALCIRRTVRAMTKRAATWHAMQRRSDGTAARTDRYHPQTKRLV